MFPNIVSELYSNLSFEESSLKSIVKIIKIDIHRAQIRRMLEFPLCGVSYTYEKPIKFKKFKLSTAIIFFVMNLMDY